MDKKEIISSLVWLCISIAVMISSLQLGIGPFDNPGPGFLAFWAGALLALLSGALIILSYYREEGTPRLAHLWKDRDWYAPILIVLTLIVYCLALPNLGYLSATFGLMVVLFAIKKIKPWLTITGALLTSVFYFRLVRLSAANAPAPGPFRLLICSYGLSS